MNLKKLGWTLQLLIFLIVNFGGNFSHAQDMGANSPTDNQNVLKEFNKISSILPESVAYYYKFKDRNEKTTDIVSISGHFGSTTSDDFKTKVMQIIDSTGFDKSKVKVIYTLESTYGDAIILKQQFTDLGVPTVIIEIPEDDQKVIMRDAEIRQMALFDRISVRVQNGLERLKNPGPAFDKAVTIMKHQKQTKPSGKDIFYNTVYTTLGTASAGLTSFYLSGVDPHYAAALTFATFLVTASKTFFGSTIGNLLQANYFNSFTVQSKSRQILYRMTVLGLAVDQFFFVLGNTLSEGAYKLTQEQILANAALTGYASTAAGIERSRRLPGNTNEWVTMTFFAFATTLSVLKSMGHTGPEIWHYGDVHFTLLQAGGVVASVTIALGLKAVHKSLHKMYVKTLKNNRESVIERLDQRGPIQEYSCSALFSHK